VAGAAARNASGVVAASLRERLWSTTDALVDGTVTLDAVTALASELLAGADLSVIGEAGPYAGAVTIALFDEPGFGRATLDVAVLPDDPERPPRRQAEFRIGVEPVTRSGYYTGLPQDRDERTDLKLAVRVAESGAPTVCWAAAQNVDYGYSQALFVALRGQEPRPVGGNFVVRSDGAVWRQLTLRAGSSHGSTYDEHGQPVISFERRMLDPLPREVELDDPRLGALGLRLYASLAAAAR
jgi:hypothetical protein